MTRYGGRLRATLGLTLWVVTTAGCGGEGNGSGENGVSANGTQPGSVSVRNDTAFPVEVAYLDSVSAREPSVVRVTIDSGSQREVTDGDLPAGMEIELDVALGPTKDGHRVRRKVRVRVEGDLVLRVALEDPGDPFSVQFVEER